MLQSIQLLFELILLGLVLYLYWRFRKGITLDQESESAETLTTGIQVMETEAVRIAQDMSVLLKEFQRASTIVKDDIRHQINDCNQAIKHAELVLAELMAQVQNMSVTEVSYSVDKPRNRIFNSRDLEYGEIDTPIGIDPAWGTGNSTSRSQKSPLSEMNRYQTVLSLASQGTDPEDISLRTGLEREAIRILLANNQQIINKEKDHQYMNIR